MLGYLIRRVVYAVFAVWAVSIISFFIINLPPGDYVTSYIAQLAIQGKSTREVAEKLGISK